jgi:hypothetical protein
LSWDLTRRGDDNRPAPIEATSATTFLSRTKSGETAEPIDDAVESALTQRPEAPVVWFGLISSAALVQHCQKGTVYYACVEEEGSFFDYQAIRFVD